MAAAAAAAAAAVVALRRERTQVMDTTEFRLSPIMMKKNKSLGRGGWGGGRGGNRFTDVMGARALNL